MEYKIKGVSSYGERHLSVVDIESIESMIGETIIRSEDLGNRLFEMPDGEIVHEDFIIVEELKDTTNDTTKKA